MQYWKKTETVQHDRAAPANGHPVRRGLQYQKLAQDGFVGITVFAVSLHQGLTKWHWAKRISTGRGGSRKHRGRCAFEHELGVQPPLGFWDPLGFTKDGDALAFRRRRSAELKHARIAMLAAMGYITPDLVGKWPGYLSPSMGLKFADIPNGVGAIPAVPSLGWVQILIYFGFVEYSAGFEEYREGTPGDFGWKILTSPDPVERKRKLNSELANGRLAMVAIVIMVFQDDLTGSPWGTWFHL